MSPSPKPSLPMSKKPSNSINHDYIPYKMNTLRPEESINTRRETRASFKQSSDQDVSIAFIQSKLTSQEWLQLQQHFQSNHHQRTFPAAPQRHIVEDHVRKLEQHIASLERQIQFLKDHKLKVKQRYEEHLHQYSKQVKQLQLRLKQINDEKNEYMTQIMTKERELEAALIHLTAAQEEVKILAIDRGKCFTSIDQHEMEEVISKSSKYSVQQFARLSSEIDALRLELQSEKQARTKEKIHHEHELFTSESKVHQLKQVVHRYEYQAQYLTNLLAHYQSDPNASKPGPPQLFRSSSTGHMNRRTNRSRSASPATKPSAPSRQSQQPIRSLRNKSLKQFLLSETQDKDLPINKKPIPGASTAILNQPQRLVYSQKDSPIASQRPHRYEEEESVNGLDHSLVSPTVSPKPGKIPNVSDFKPFHSASHDWLEHEQEDNEDNLLNQAAPEDYNEVNQEDAAYSLPSPIPVASPLRNSAVDFMHWQKRKQEHEARASLSPSKSYVGPAAPQPSPKPSLTLSVSSLAISPPNNQTPALNNSVKSATRPTLSLQPVDNEDKKGKGAEEVLKLLSGNSTGKAEGNIPVPQTVQPFLYNNAMPPLSRMHRSTSPQRDAYVYQDAMTSPLPSPSPPRSSPADTTRSKPATMARFMATTATSPMAIPSPVPSPLTQRKAMRSSSPPRSYPTLRTLSRVKLTRPATASALPDVNGSGNLASRRGMKGLSALSPRHQRVLGCECGEDSMQPPSSAMTSPTLSQWPHDYRLKDKVELVVGEDWEETEVINDHILAEHLPWSYELYQQHNQLIDEYNQLLHDYHHEITSKYRIKHELKEEIQDNVDLDCQFQDSKQHFIQENLRLQQTIRELEEERSCQVEVTIADQLWEELMAKEEGVSRIGHRLVETLLQQVQSHPKYGERMTHVLLRRQTWLKILQFIHRIDEQCNEQYLSLQQQYQRLEKSSDHQARQLLHQQQLNLQQMQELEQLKALHREQSDKLSEQEMTTETMQLLQNRLDETLKALEEMKEVAIMNKESKLLTLQSPAPQSEQSTPRKLSRSSGGNPAGDQALITELKARVDYLHQLLESEGSNGTPNTQPQHSKDRSPSIRHSPQQLDSQQVPKRSAATHDGTALGLRTPLQSPALSAYQQRGKILSLLPMPSQPEESSNTEQSRVMMDDEERKSLIDRIEMLSHRNDMLTQQIQSVPASLAIAQAEKRVVDEKLKKATSAYETQLQRIQSHAMQQTKELKAFLAIERQERQALQSKIQDQSQTIHQLTHHLKLFQSKYQSMDPAEVPTPRPPNYSQLMSQPGQSFSSYSDPATPLHNQTSTPRSTGIFTQSMTKSGMGAETIGNWSLHPASHAPTRSATKSLKEEWQSIPPPPWDATSMPRLNHNISQDKMNYSAYL